MSPMTHLYRLDQIQPSDHYAVGDKAFYLADLQHRGYSVVPGYVVSATVFQVFLKSIQWLEPLFADLPNSTLHLDVNDAHQLQAIAQQIRQAIFNTPLPDIATESLQQIVESMSSAGAILRPSLTLQTGIDPQLGGQIQGLLAAQFCQVSVAELSNHLRRLWAELFRAKSLVYWQRSQIPLEQINFAVLIQPLANSAIAGNFHLDTQTAHIEAIQGLGLALAHGEATPEQWWITLRQGQVERHRVGQQFLEYRLPRIEGTVTHSDRDNLLNDLDERDSDSTHPSHSALVGIPAGNPPYQVEIVDDPTLLDLFPSAEILQELIQIAHSVGTALGTTLDLEWTYGSLSPNYQSVGAAGASAQLFITQVNPKALRYDPDFALPDEIQWRDRNSKSAQAEPSLESSVRQSARQSVRQSAIADSSAESGRTIPSEHHTHQSQDDLVVMSGLAASAGQASGIAQVVVDPQAEPKALPAGAILVTSEVTPAWLPLLKQAAGIVSEQGGLTCHGAIIARELGIPAVVGVPGVTQQIRNRDRIYIDGDLGHIYSEQTGGEPIDDDQIGGEQINSEQPYGKWSDDEQSRPEYDYDKPHELPPIPYSANSEQPQFEPQSTVDHTSTAEAVSTDTARLDRLSSTLQPSTSLPIGPSSPLPNSLRTPLEAWSQIPATPKLEFQRIPTATELWVNVSQLQSVPKLRSLPIDGIGLLRSELMLLEALDGEHPSNWLSQYSPEAFVERLAEHILPFAQALAPRPVFYRSLDWRSYEMNKPQPSVIGKNPVLGIRGTFSYQLDSTLFDLELAAISQVQQSGYDNLRLILPFVRSVQEVQFCQKRIDRAAINTPNFQLWLMAEVPSVLFLLPNYIWSGIQGISIGTNDLTQLLLGADRDHAQLGAAFNERHPAVVAAIEQLVKTARQHNIPCSICGQAPIRDPKLIESLIRWGITSISVELDAVESTYWEIVRTEKRLLLEQLRE